MTFVSDDKRIICPMCNRVCIKLVPLYDNDQKHEKQQCCVGCKRNIRQRKEIKKFKLDPQLIKSLEGAR